MISNLWKVKREICQIWWSNIKKDWVRYILFNNHILHKEIECSKRSIMDVKKGFTNHAKHSKTSKRKNKTFYACENMNTLWSLSIAWVFELNYYWKYTSKIFMVYQCCRKVNLSMMFAIFSHFFQILRYNTIGKYIIWWRDRYY